ncbi:PucR family transcriptional regulator [Priestia filamentosa]|uniref:PucR family transcriptional regulator n=2 Tax=Priestia filamentosa TaxID=1402861 RepID=UPI001FB3D5B8|nr:PucR family transcriptional regulator [Priestia filamentosa]MED3726273.1 PucR family transcriptional regulator ligand-binding domain-containing protein [Priestia filamentosa]UOE59280.1 PucR family transcriptional regulator [Priestia filamentosa]
MNFEGKLSVQEILQTQHFADAKVIAGEAGIHRLIRWVHVLEVTSIQNLLHGNELILSTGVGWKEDHNSFYSLVQQSINANAAGLCIELGTYISKIPQKIIDLANSYDFPIIVFFKKVKFIDITQEIHSLLIKKHYQILEDLEEYSSNLNQLLLSSNPHKKILEFLHDYLKVTVFYISNQGEIQVIPKKTPIEQEKIFQALQREEVTSSLHSAHQSVQALDHTFADLFIVSERDEITEFDSLILDRSAIALAQSLLRELYIEEQRKTEEGEWVRTWLAGKNSEEQIHKYLLEIDPNLRPNGCTVLLCKAENLNKVTSEFNYFKLYTRSIFERKGIFLLTHIEKDTIIFILLNNRKDNDFKYRVQEVIDHLKGSEFIKKQKLSHLEFSVGKFVNNLDYVKSSYHTAKETMSLREKMPNELLNYFYEDLYIFRLVLAANSQGVLHEFIHDYIGPVLLHDQQNNGELLKTLKVYLQCKGAKKETAEQLHIVRQTLYHRLDRLYELIGRDFMEPYKRQAIEASISAYEYASASKFSYEYISKFKSS